MGQGDSYLVPFYLSKYFTIMEENCISFIEYCIKGQEFYHIREVEIWGKRME